MGQEEGVGVVGGGGGGGEQRVAPRREEGEVEVGDGGEAEREVGEVARVSPECEGGARGPLRAPEFAAREGEGVPCSGVGYYPDYGREYGVRQVVDCCGGGHGGFMTSRLIV